MDLREPPHRTVEAVTLFEALCACWRSQKLAAWFRLNPTREAGHPKVQRPENQEQKGNLPAPRE